MSVKLSRRAFLWIVSALLVIRVIIGVIVLKDKPLLPLVSHYLLRIVASAILVWVAFACLIKVYVKGLFVR